MAVLCEAISVVVRAHRALQAFGSFEDFKRVISNATLVADNELMRVGFMAPDDVRAFVDLLGGFGLQYIVDGKAQDLVVVDQMRGPAAPCHWLEFGHIEMSGCKVAAARLRGGSSKQLFTPEGWTVTGSLSQTFGFAPISVEGKGMKFLRREGSMDVYLNSMTGKEVYVGRTSSRGT